MLVPVNFTHEAMGSGLHRFLFASSSRRGVKHSLLVDVGQDVPPVERLQCSCDASMFNRLCKHKRWLLRGPTT